MSLRSILVPVRGDGKGESVLDHALCLARRHNAHIEVLHCRPKPEDMVPYGVPLPSSLRQSLINSAKGLADEEEGKMRQLFDAYCEKRGIQEVDDFPWPQDAVSATWREATGKQANVIGVKGRLVDLIAVPKPDRSQNLGLNTLQAALLESGKLVLMCPPQDCSSLGARIAIAWNGSGEVARAVTAALPVLKLADEVILLTPEGKDLPVTAGEAAIYLETHGVSCRTQSFARTSSTIAETLLDNAKKVGADSLLMGAYGQSRQRELIMGGVTQFVVDHADLPILLMH